MGPVFNLNNHFWFKINKLSCEASVAQLVEQLICNQWAGGSNPFAGSKFDFSLQHIAIVG